MVTRASAVAFLAVAPAIFAAPAPQVTSFGPDSQVPYQPQSTAGPDYPVVVEQNGYTSAPYHGPYNGTATTTGAANGPSTIAASIPTQPPNPTATYYNANGVPQNPLPAPYIPAGGLGTNGSLPRYMVESDFDFESIALGLYQEWIELDLFHDGLARFSIEELEAAGLNAEYRSLINFMANQESGHATLLTNMLGEAAPKQCKYLIRHTPTKPCADDLQAFTIILTLLCENGSTSCNALLALGNLEYGASSITWTPGRSVSSWRNQSPPKLASSKSSAR